MGIAVRPSDAVRGVMILKPRFSEAGLMAGKEGNDPFLPTPVREQDRTAAMSLDPR